MLAFSQLSQTQFYIVSFELNILDIYFSFSLRDQYFGLTSSVNGCVLCRLNGNFVIISGFGFSRIFFLFILYECDEFSGSDK